ncbi:hypothetical protein NDU88_008561 [Pleurodeles waltl]|uniref:Uncharacterized protein n=1 Tax=Pleurodeles waltl TaxID=8319 RepID=A0AAV7NWW5_PLEWA|nr:hypothetical protein NDU88_008561 [Pleurodeles waltl]
MVAAVRWGRLITRTRTWRLQLSLLRDSPFRAELADGIDSYFKINTKSPSLRAVEWDRHKVVVPGLCMSASGGVRRTLTAELHSIEDELREVVRRVETGREDMSDMTGLKKQWVETDALKEIWLPTLRGANSCRGGPLQQIIILAGERQTTTLHHKHHPLRCRKHSQYTAGDK